MLKNKTYLITYFAILLFTTNIYAKTVISISSVVSNTVISNYLLVVLILLLACVIVLIVIFIFTQKSKSYRFKQLSSATFEGIIIHNNGRILDVNRSFEKMSGYRHDELLQMSIFDFIDKDVYNEFINKNGGHYETFIKTIFNNKIIVELLEKPYAISRKSVKVIAIRDITDLNKMLEQNRLLSAAVEQSANTVVITDKGGKIIYVNPKFTQLTGYSSSEAIGNSPSILKSGMQNSDYYKTLWTTISSGKEWHGEFHNRKKNGELFWEEAFIAPVKNVKNEIEYYIAIKENITKRKITEQALLDSEKKLRELNATKDKFFSIIAHDLKSPIGNIKTFLDIILDNRANNNQENFDLYIKMLKENISATYSMLENLLSWARSQQGIIPYLPENIVYKSLTDETIALLTLVANKKQIQLINNIPENLMVYCDKNMIVTVILNLISNAIKFSFANTTVTVSAYIESGFIRTNITDQGVGIKTDDLSNVFDKNKYYSTYGTDYEKGHGLGLTLCTEFIEKHGGTLNVTSEYGKGSTFYFTVPVMK